MPNLNQTLDEVRNTLLTSSSLQSAISSKTFNGQFSDFSDIVISESYGTPQLEWFNSQEEMTNWIRQTKDEIGDLLYEKGLFGNYD